MSHLITYDVTITETRQAGPVITTTSNANRYLLEAYHNMHGTSPQIPEALGQIGAGLELLRDAYSVADRIADTVQIALTEDQRNTYEVRTFIDQCNNMHSHEADLFRHSFLMWGNVENNTPTPAAWPRTYIDHLEQFLNADNDTTPDISAKRLKLYSPYTDTNFSFRLFTLSDLLECGDNTTTQLIFSARHTSGGLSAILNGLAWSCAAGFAVVAGAHYLGLTYQNIGNAVDVYYTGTGEAPAAASTFSLFSDYLYKCRVTMENLSTERNRNDPDQLADLLEDDNPNCIEHVKAFLKKREDQEEQDKNRYTPKHFRDLLEIDLYDLLTPESLSV